MISAALSLAQHLSHGPRRTLGGYGFAGIIQQSRWSFGEALRSLPDLRAPTAEQRDTNGNREKRQNRGGCHITGSLDDSQRNGSGSLRHGGWKTQSEREEANPQPGRDRYAENGKQCCDRPAEESFPAVFSNCPEELNRRDGSQPKTARGHGELRHDRGLKKNTPECEGKMVSQVPAHRRLEC